MDWATILVLVLFAGVVALLAWFEVNSRRNEASKEEKAAAVEALLKRNQTTVEPNPDNKKAA